MRKNKLSLNLIITTFGLSVAIFPLIIYLVVAVYSSAKTLEATHEKELAQQNLLTATLINQSIAEKIGSLGSLSAQLELMGRLPLDSIAKFLDDEIAKRNDISGVAIYSDQLAYKSAGFGKLLASQEVLDFVDECQEGEMRSLIASGVISVDDEPYLFLCSKTKSALIFAINFNNIELLLTQFDDDLEGENPVILIDQEDNIIFTTGEKSEQLALDQRILDVEDESVVLRDVIIGKEKAMVAIEEINTFGDNDGVGWRLIAPLSEKTIQAKLVSTLKLNVLTGLLIIAVSFVAAILLARVIITPLRKIVPMAQAIKEGDYSSRLDLRFAPKEIDIIADSLNEMANRVETRTAELEEAKQEVEELHKQTRDSIDFASLIQHSLIPRNILFREFFGDYFVLWHPKDVVGGDIYFFELLNGGNEALLIVADCTGHGVPGAFVTMMVKAVEKEIVADLKKGNRVSTSEILQKFNRDMKGLLKQNSDDALSNAGFDGVVLYINKTTKTMQFSGANLPLYYVQNGEQKLIKGDRESIGYKKSKEDFVFSEHTIEFDSSFEFYISTDGYIDQNGGENGFPFGRGRFTKLIDSFHSETMSDQQEIFLDELHAYQQNEPRNDDVTLIGFRFLGLDH